jgi:hypothetical protein
MVRPKPLSSEHVTFAARSGLMGVWREIAFSSEVGVNRIIFPLSTLISHSSFA